MQNWAFFLKNTSSIKLLNLLKKEGFFCHLCKYLFECVIPIALEKVARLGNACYEVIYTFQNRL